jgi:hypothetical protein
LDGCQLLALDYIIGFILFEGGWFPCLIPRNIDIESKVLAWVLKEVEVGRRSTDTAKVGMGWCFKLLLLVVSVLVKRNWKQAIVKSGEFVIFALVSKVVFLDFEVVFFLWIISY